MKTRTYLGLLICGLLISNCSQEDNNLISEGNYSIITASIESAAKTRSTVTEGGEFAWAKGDKISVQQQTGGFATYVYGNDSQFVMEGSSASPLGGVAYYPANTNHTNSAFTLAAEYDLDNNTRNTNAPMIASVSQNATDFSFRHLGGVLRFIFRSVPAEANKFVFSTNKAISGSFDIATSNGTQVIVVDDTPTDENNTITINFNAGQSTEMTFYVPMPIGTYNSMSVAFYNDATELWSASSTATNIIDRASLLLMPTLTCTANASTASTSDAVNSALESVTEDKPEASVNLTGEATNEDISIPESFTEAATEESNLNLTYNDVPTAVEAITISDANTSAEQSDSKGNVNISIPNVADESEAPSFNINLPTMTVTLQANVENATYNEVTASTAKNTLRIAKGVTVKKLILNGGNIVIEEGATVNAVVNKQGFEGKTYVVTLGTLTNNPNLDNVTVVDSEDDIPSYELRVLTFEDGTEGFEPYECEFFYAMNYTEETKYIEKWSDYIPRDGQYGNGHGSYEWYDEGNTELEFVKPTIESWWGISGHAGISDYVGTDEDIAKFGDDNMMFMIDLQAYNVTGGANGSKNFCSQYGYLDPEQYATQYSPEGVLPGIQFHDGIARVIDHMYVTNTTYSYAILVNGEMSFGGNYMQTDESWFKVIAYGYDSFEDTEPTIAEFFLMNTNYRIVTDWTKWDLSSLGEVVRVEFNLVAYDNGYGCYGLVLPAYFAYDDVAVRFEK